LDEGGNDSVRGGETVGDCCEVENVDVLRDRLEGVIEEG